MLLEIFINDFILIEKENMSFCKGLNVITGETGSGKSIILNGIKTLLGQNKSKNIIMTGKDNSIIEGVFSIENDSTINFIKSNGFSVDDNQIIITREISKSRSSSKINGRPCLNGFIKELGNMLVDFHGQHDSMDILNTYKQLEIIDTYGQISIKSKKEKIAKKVLEIKKVEDEIFKINSLVALDPKEIDFLKYQIDEIESAFLKEGEDVELEKNLEILKNSELINDNLNKSFSILNGKNSVQDSLYSVNKLLSDIKDYDNKINEFYNYLQDIIINTEDLYRSINSYIDDFEINEEELFDIENRFNLINELKRKYGKTIKDVLEYLDGAKEKYNYSLESSNILQEYKNKLKKLQEEYFILAKDLSFERKKSSKIFEKNILKEFKELNLKDTNLKVEFKELNEISCQGIDKVMFSISTNLGEPYKAINKIASGGEISRIMLGIKTILNDSNNDKTIVYDEIDTGISGKTAEIVGIKMYNVSKKNQIISVTHLPQIAVMADDNIVVEKETKNNRTYTKIKKADNKILKHELGRLIAGRNISDITILNVDQMINYSKNFKL